MTAGYILINGVIWGFAHGVLSVNHVRCVYFRKYGSHQSYYKTHIFCLLVKNDISSKLVPRIIECVPDNLKWLVSAKAFSSNKKRAIRGINKSSGIFILFWRSYSLRWLFVILLKNFEDISFSFEKITFFKLVSWGSLIVTYAINV